MVVGLLDNKSPDLNRFTLVTPKSENDVRLQATLDNQNPKGLPVGAVSWDFAMEQNDNLYLFPINPYTYYIVKEQDMPLCKTDFKEMQLRDAKNDYRFHNEEWKEMEGCKYYYDRNAMAVTKITY